MMGRWLLMLLAAIPAVLCIKLPKFKDVSAEVGLLSYEEMDKRVPRNNKYWGSTIGDFDRNGKYDIFVSNHGNNAELYFGKNNVNTFKYVNPKLRSRDIHSTAAADMNNDGYLDLVATLGGANGNNVKGFPTIMKTSKTKTVTKGFTERWGFKTVPFRGRASAFLDVNGDGLLDLLFVNRRNHSATYAHHLYENMGDKTFKLRRNTGMEEVNAAWFHIVDVNNDSKPDLLFMKFNGVELYLGTGEFRFEKATDLIPRANRPRMSNCRAVAEIDYDNDGDLDLFFVRGTQFKERHDVLLRLNGDKYVDSTTGAGLRLNGKHYHVTTGDFNNDGFMDMFVSRMNYFQTERVDDIMLLNQGDNTFKITEQGAPEPEDKLSDGDNANAVDFDLDGNLDLLVGSRNSTWNLYRNEMRQGSLNNYLLVRVGSPRGQLFEPYWFRRAALGALVKVLACDRTFVQRVGSQGQSHSQSYMDTLHFGLGKCKTVDSIEIHYWHDVVVKRITPVAVNTLVEIGMYYVCPRGFIGRRCQETVRRCTMNPCAEGDECETVELVGDKCEEEKCAAIPQQIEDFVDPDEPEAEETPVEPEPEETPGAEPECNPDCLKLYCPI